MKAIQIRTFRRAGLLLVAIAALAVSAAPLSSLDPQSDSILTSDSTLTAVTQRAGATESVGVIIRASGDTDSLVAAIEAAGGSVERQYTIIPAVQATVPSAALETLAADAAVAHISLDAPIEMAGKPEQDKDAKGKGAKGEGAKGKDRGGENDLRGLFGPFTSGGAERGDYSDLASVFPSAVGATDVWDEGYTGRGVGIAVIDTGINDDSGTDFGDEGGRIVAEFSVMPSTEDRYGHGTHVAGIAAGDGQHSDARYMGIAPGAHIIAVKVGDIRGARLGDIIAGLQWVVDHRMTYNIRVVNLSLTSSVAESYLTNPLNAAVEQAWFQGIVVVVAAGNRGVEDLATDHPPANDPFVITVGAFGDNGTVDPGDDELKSWSSRGVTREGFAKPDVVAPGSRLIATTGDRQSLLFSRNRDNRVGDHYFRMGGTSAAAPVVTGVVALMLEKNPELTPDEVKARLTASAVSVLNWDAQRVDAYAAVFANGGGVANQGLQPSFWIDPQTGSIQDKPVPVDAIAWDFISWDFISWDFISWDFIGWDFISWDFISWDTVIEERR